VEHIELVNNSELLFEFYRLVPTRLNGIDEINDNAYAALALCPDFNAALRVRPTRTIFNIPWAKVTISIKFIQTSAYIQAWQRLLSNRLVIDSRHNRILSNRIN
jgi:hypothetical protein